MNHIPDIVQHIKNKSVLIVGFGREGNSTYNFIRKHLPEKHITIADKNKISIIDPYLTIISGVDYLKHLNQYDLIFKTPGVSFKNLTNSIDCSKITSQTDLFLQWYGNQTIGVTGTKGKSTTSSLIFHILKEANRDVVFGGNIGIPLFDLIPSINPDTIIVSELSAHQLEFIHKSPHISVLLNLFQDHLDHFNSIENYFNAKWNINKFQNQGDLFIFNDDDLTIKHNQNWNINTTYLGFSQTKIIDNGAYIDQNQIIIKSNNNIKFRIPIQNLSHLPGNHNLNNIMAAILTCYSFGITLVEIEKHIQSFSGLEHRIEFVGIFDDVHYYNDSISTIPEATISALKALEHVKTLILGGFDRGIDYSKLYEFLENNPVENIAFTGPAGERMMVEWKNHKKSIKNLLFTNNYNQILEFCRFQTPKNGKCLLSPAAASYDQFKNFEERGIFFKNQIKKQS